jgi:hypothetical protein
MSDASGGYIRIPEDTLQGYRLTEAETVVSRAAVQRYGIEYLKHIFGTTTIHIAEDLLASWDEDGKDRPETPGGQP